MKKLLLMLCAAAGLGLESQAQSWVEQNTMFTVTSRGIRDIDIVNPSVVWAVAYDGSGSSQPVRDFTRTTDGGTTWTPGTIVTAGAAGLNFANISAIDANTAFVSMYDPVNQGHGKLYKTTNGGASWTDITTPTMFAASGGFVNMIHMYDANNGWTMGDPTNGYFEIYTTTDGGANWSRVPSAAIAAELSGETAIIDLYTVIGNDVWFGTSRGRVYHSPDRGLTWPDVWNTGLTSIHEISFRSPLVGLVRENTGLKKTTDGGQTWANVNYTGPLHKSAMQWVPNTNSTWVSTGAAPGDLGSSYSLNDGLTWIAIDSLVQHTALDFYDNSTGWNGGFNSISPAGGNIKGIFKFQGTFPAMTIPNDAGISAVVSPVSGCSLSNAAQVCVTVKNFGTTPLSNIPVRYQLNGGAPVSATFAGPLAPGATANYCFTATVNLATAGSYTLTAFTNLTGDANTSNNTTTVTVVSSTPPTVGTITPATSSFCSNGTAVTLGATPAGGTFSGPGVTGTSFNPATAGAGTHTITYSTTNAAGCTGTGTKIVTVTAAPAVGPITGLSAAGYCTASSTPVTLGNSATGGTFSGPGVSGTTFNPATAGAGTHTISYSVTSGGCTSRATQIVSVSAPSNPNILPATSSFCVNAAPVALSGNPAGGTFSGTGVSGTTFTPATAGAGTHTITYAVSAGACSGTGTKIVTVNALPVVTLAAPTGIICNNSAPITLTGTPATLTFSGPGVTGSSFDPTAAGAGAHTITATYTDPATTCTNTATQSVTVNPAPTAAISGLDTAYCGNGAAVTLTGTPAGGTFMGTGISGSSFNPAAAGPGTYTISYGISTSGTGCADTATSVVTVHRVPVATFTQTSTGSSYTFTAATAGMTYSWSFGDPASGTGNTATTATATHNYTAAGTYNVSLTVTDAFGCSDISTATITVVGRADLLSQHLSVFPNPTSGQLQVELDLPVNGTLQAEVYSLVGQRLLSQPVRSQTREQLDLSGLAAGSYLLKLTGPDFTVMKQVILQK